MLGLPGRLNANFRRVIFERYTGSQLLTLATPSALTDVSPGLKLQRRTTNGAAQAQVSSTTLVHLRITCRTPLESRETFASTSHRPGTSRPEGKEHGERPERCKFEHFIWNPVVCRIGSVTSAVVCGWSRQPLRLDALLRMNPHVDSFARNNSHGVPVRTHVRPNIS